VSKRGSEIGFCELLSYNSRVWRNLGLINLWNVVVFRSNRHKLGVVNPNEIENLINVGFRATASDIQDFGLLKCFSNPSLLVSVTFIRFRQTFIIRMDAFIIIYLI
jgi:hypothetical protein